MKAGCASSNSKCIEVGVVGVHLPHVSTSRPFNHGFVGNVFTQGSKKVFFHPHNNISFNFIYWSCYKEYFSIDGNLNQNYLESLIFEIILCFLCSKLY